MPENGQYDIYLPKGEKGTEEGESERKREEASLGEEGTLLFG